MRFCASAIVTPIKGVAVAVSLMEVLVVVPPMVGAVFTAGV